MKAIILYLFVLLIIPSQDIWNNLIIDNELEVQQSSKDDYSYPWHVVQHSDGHFENTLGLEISKKDTTPIIHNAHCYTYLNNESANSRLKFGEGELVNDTLHLKIFDKSASNYEMLELTVFQDKFKVNYQTAYYPFPYEGIEYKFLNESLTLNTNEFKKDTSIKGQVDIELIQTVNFQNKPSSTVNKKIKGTFEILIE